MELSKYIEACQNWIKGGQTSLLTGERAFVLQEFAAYKVTVARRGINRRRFSRSVVGAVSEAR
jgi:hypothetical protein